jgi:hypothetical protein
MRGQCLPYDLYALDHTKQADTQTHPRYAFATGSHSVRLGGAEVARWLRAELRPKPKPRGPEEEMTRTRAAAATAGSRADTPLPPCSVTCGGGHTTTGAVRDFQNSGFAFGANRTLRVGDKK